MNEKITGVIKIFIYGNQRKTVNLRTKTLIMVFDSYLS